MFEEIGHMAGALTYQHVVIPLNLTSLINQANSLEGIIQFYEDRIRDTYDNASVYQPTKDGKGTTPTSMNGWTVQHHRYAPPELEFTQI